MTAYQDVYPQVPPSPSLPKGRHRDSTASGQHPLVPPALQGNPGHHVRSRRPVLAYLAVVLLPLIGALLILSALRLFGQPSAAGVVPPVLQVAVSPSVCTFPDGS